MILTCEFGGFDEDMVVSLTRLTLSAIENASKFSFSVEYLEYLSVGRITLEMLWCYAFSFFYGGQLFFVDIDWQKV